MDNVIEIEGLTKVYKNNIVALDNVSFEVKRGEIFALLGLNGAGKTTLMKIVLGLLRATSGKVLIFGEISHSDKLKDKIGYLPELFQAPSNWNVKDTLNFLGRLSGFKGSALKNRIDEVLGMVDLKEDKSKKASELSKGMLIRLGLAQALINKPEILLLDEPTEGLDPVSRRKIRELLLELKSNGVTILLNSHLLSEVELIADRVGILHKGKLVVYGSLKDIVPKTEKYQVEISTPKIESFKLEFDRFSYIQEGDKLVVTVEGVENLEEVLRITQKYSARVVAIIPNRSSLEDVFISYIN